ncbi:RNA 2'-phosphotransferase [Aureimonas pseudogalii]|uniref:Probable RNA 2'-phosphotransferase n=1 Tax=Aureimonas pseudogalii TaxID=1744844 RepID=A0A7W6H5Z3_9HYPH|nr:RNA 2'-phosphotransferase [Aureimonas pseudogalii]MBB3999185.1 putative RNA 2'-phosphotransferase [Aureimonas pseudogalii]
MANDTDVSKFMSLVLRHAPHEAGLALDEAGWADFRVLCSAIETRFGVSENDVRRIVDENQKKRFVVLGEKVRAAQGHSVAVDIGLQASRPPALLFHGTKASNRAAIMAEGLSKRRRHHVHLSIDRETAEQVAARRAGESLILEVDARAMQAAGAEFFLSENGVWLTDAVPPKFLTSSSEPDRP